MDWLRQLRFRFFALFRKRTLEAEMAEEIRLHLEREAELNAKAGMSPEEAHYAAQRQFGGLQQVKESCRDEWAWLWLENFVKDLRLGTRSLLKSPCFTFIAVGTLALGIGVNTSMFSLLNALLLRPLPYSESDQLVRLFRATSENDRGNFSPADYLDLKRAETGFGQFAGYTNWNASLAEPGRPAEMKTVLRVSADFFQMLEVKPHLGRAFQPEEEIYGSHRVVLISYALWQDRFGGSADIVGRTVRIDGEPNEIIGVLPDWATERRPFSDINLFRPLGFTEAERTSRSSFPMNIIGRRQPGLSLSQGRAFVAAVGNRLAKDFPTENTGAAWKSETLAGSAMNPIGRAIVVMLVGLSAFVLLIACSNLANFLLARTVARSREFAVRAALGASRWQLIRPLAWESLLLAMAGGASALLVAAWTSHWLSSQTAADGGRALELPLDWRVLGFAFGMSILTALGFGVAPALFATRVDVNDTLKSGSRGATASRGHRRLRHLLIVGQFALAMILLTGAGFFLRGASNILKQQYGWDSDHLIQGTIVLPPTSYPDGEKITAFHRRVIERLRTLPGVESVSMSYSLPFLGLSGSRRYIVEGRELPPKGKELSAEINGITPDYFRTTGTRLVSGRMFFETDTAGSPRVVVLSESMARALFPNGDAIGHRVAQVGNVTPAWLEIIGVAADVHSIDLSARPPYFQLYQPIAQEPWNDNRLAVRTRNVAIDSLIEPIRTIISTLDPDLPVRDLVPVNTLIERSTNSNLGVVNRLLTGFAVLGLLLAVLGIYGVIERGVTQRTPEIGIRMALGAQANDVMRLILGSGIRLALTGAAIGLIGGFGLSRLIASALPSMHISSGLVLLVATVLLITVALVACYLPANKASKISPIVALRSE